jgi:putative endonuclease
VGRLGSTFRRLIGRPGTGAAGEDLACLRLEAAGMKIICRNYRCRAGEIDVIARDGSVVVFVEVKERGDSSHGLGCEAVTRGKRRRIIQAAQLYASRHGLTEEPLRFDVVSVDWEGGALPRIRHDRDAFDVDGE